MSETKPIVPILGGALVVCIAAALVGWLLSDTPNSSSSAPHPQAASGAEAKRGAGALAGELEKSLAAEEDPHLLSLKGILAENPEDLEALLGVGYLYVQQRAYSKAKGYYLRAAQVAPGSLEARTHLGTVAYFLGDVDEALHHYDQVLSVDPDYTVALFEMGAVLRFGKGDLEGAATAWERFLGLDPEAEEAEQIRDLVAETRALIAEGPVSHGTAPDADATPAPEADPAHAPWPGEAPS